MHVQIHVLQVVSLVVRKLAIYIVKIHAKEFVVMDVLAHVRGNAQDVLVLVKMDARGIVKVVAKEVVKMDVKELAKPAAKEQLSEVLLRIVIEEHPLAVIEVAIILAVVLLPLGAPVVLQVVLVIVAAHAQEGAMVNVAHHVEAHVEQAVWEDAKAVVEQVAKRDVL